MSAIVQYNLYGITPQLGFGGYYYYYYCLF